MLGLKKARAIFIRVELEFRASGRFVDIPTSNIQPKFNSKSNPLSHPIHTQKHISPQNQTQIGSSLTQIHSQGQPKSKSIKTIVQIQTHNTQVHNPAKNSYLSPIPNIKQHPNSLKLEHGHQTNSTPRSLWLCP